jgi:hypothetical protein
MMLRRAPNSKNLIACLLAAGTGLTLYFHFPFPEENFFLDLLFLRACPVFLGATLFYVLFLYTTPYIFYSILLSGLYIVAIKTPSRLRPGRLPAYSLPRNRDSLCLVIGEIHKGDIPGPADHPAWLSIPERGLFTGIAAFGAVGSGKTSCGIYPFAEQILAFKADQPEKRIGGLVLEVKGDFCHKVRDILARCGREEDYVEISLHSEYRYNPCITILTPTRSPTASRRS